MMSAAVRASVLVAGAVAVGLLTSGCKKEGGSGLFGGLFGGSDSADSFESPFGAGGAAGDVVFSTDSGPPFSFGSSPATVHHPEPASLALFGSGLVGLAVWRRRKSRSS